MVLLTRRRTLTVTSGSVERCENGASLAGPVAPSLDTAFFYPDRDLQVPVMHLMYTIDEAGNRIYTLKVSQSICHSPANAEPRWYQKVADSGRVTKSAHPGLFPTPYPRCFGM
jgi:hypothetical protein